MVILVSSAGIVGSVTSASEEEIKPSRIFDLAKPAVVMINVTVSAEISVPQAEIDPFILSQRMEEIAFELERRGFDLSEIDPIPIALEEIAIDPLLYLVPTPFILTEEATIGMVGSGFLVTPDGYIVTNAHVAVPDEDVLKENLAFSDAVVDLMFEIILATFGEEVAAGIAEDYPDLIEPLTFASALYAMEYMSIGKPNVQVYSTTGAILPSNVTAPKETITELIDHGEAIPGKDVAIIKMEGNNLPAIPLGDDKDMRIGEKIYVIGFPGVATFHPALAEESIVEPTLTSGLLSARKTMPDEWKVLQTDAAVSHGNSGGPAFDSSGEVIGIATFISVDPFTGEEVAGFNFIVPSTIIKEFLQKNNIEVEESLFTKSYSQALDEYEQGNYKKALELFQQSDSLQPGIPIVQEYIAESQEKVLEAQAEEEAEIQPTQDGGIAGGAPSACLIATAAFGSELTPQVQFLRDFRDNHILSTAAGSSFMSVFNAWYYSFSPYVADYERQQPWLQQTVKASIYPLLGILTASEKAYSSIDGEYGALAAGLIASSMIGALYFWPFALSVKQVRAGIFNFKLALSAIAIVFVAVVSSILAGNEPALMVSSSLFVLTLLSLSAIISAMSIIKLTRKVHRG